MMPTLIERLEQSEGSAELDEATHECLINLGIDHAAYQSPTQILDHAVALVPEGWAWFVEWIGKPFSEGAARVWIPSQRTQGLKVEDVYVEANTPALALCIAALRAREAGDA